MNLLIVSDIFGFTLALKSLVSKLVSKLPSIRTELKIVDPYNGKDPQFNTQDEAYRYFTDNIGLDTYTDQLKNKILRSPSPVILIGFSIGASAIWKLSDSDISPHIQQAICFYGSQIRHYTQLNPHFDIELIFPRKESHFDIEQLSKELSHKPNIKCTSSDGLHGFMNELSSNFNNNEYSRFLTYLKKRLTNTKQL
jgi:hypothetical protein